MGFAESKKMRGKSIDIAEKFVYNRRHRAMALQLNRLGRQFFCRQKGIMAMAKYTKEDILRIAKEEDVQFFRLQFTDIFGQLKNVAVPLSQLKKLVFPHPTVSEVIREGLFMI